MLFSLLLYSRTSSAVKIVPSSREVRDMFSRLMEMKYVFSRSSQ